jgi:hypothetical protein
MAPMVHGLKKKYEGRVNFAFIDVDDARNDATRQALGSIYTPEYYLVDKNGNIVKKWIGLTKLNDFEKGIQAQIQANP